MGMGRRVSIAALDSFALVMLNLIVDNTANKSASVKSMHK
jgi:hypothetical protein